MTDEYAGEAIGVAELNQIKGRASVEKTTHDDVLKLLGHIDALEDLLDEGDQDDAFGTEGWRHRAGIDG